MLAITMTQGWMIGIICIYGSVWNLCGCFFRTWQKEKIDSTYIHRVIW